MTYDYQYDNYGIHGFMGDLVMDFELQDEDNKEVFLIIPLHRLKPNT